MSYFTAQDGLWDTISSIGKTAGSTVLNVYGAQKQAEGQAMALQQMAAGQGVAPSAFPSWLLPVALGGVGIFVVYMLMKKPRQNPGRRRRSRRRNEYFTYNPRRKRR